MIYIEWVKWINNIQWSFKWFLLLILIRPVADTFYYSKDTSIILSPPNIIAALTIPLVFLSTTTGRRSGVRSGMSYIDLIVIVWGGLVFMNGVTLFLDLEFLSALETFLRSRSEERRVGKECRSRMGSYRDMMNGQGIWQMFVSACV